MSPLFICDNTVNPGFLLPLSIGEDGKTDYFGTSELEDTPVYVTSRGKELFLRAREIFNAPKSIQKVNQKQADELRTLDLITSERETGIKVVIHDAQPISGSQHFSPRNMKRAMQALSRMGAKWITQHNPSEEAIRSVFENSIGQFNARDKVSKFSDSERQEKYLKIFGSSIHGVLAFLSTCTVRDVPAISALFLLHNSVATVSTITVNPQHPQSKEISQYGFRYAIANLAVELNAKCECTTVDFQGGNYTWKQEIDPKNQVKQYDLEMNDENI